MTAELWQRLIRLSQTSLLIAIIPRFVCLNRIVSKGAGLGTAALKYPPSVSRPQEVRSARGGAN
jgi:hypothetical protein